MKKYKLVELAICICPFQTDSLSLFVLLCAKEDWQMPSPLSSSCFQPGENASKGVGREWVGVLVNCYRKDLAWCWAHGTHWVELPLLTTLVKKGLDY